MSHLFLSHLSKNNNHPQIVEDLFKKNAGDTVIVVASRYNETPVYEIKGSMNELPELNIVPLRKEGVQMKLFV